MLWIAFIIAGLSSIAGFGVATYFDSRNRRAKPLEAAISESPTDCDSSEADAQFVREFLETVNALTAEVNNNVTRHASRVETISTNLLGETSSDSKSVLQAATQLIDANKQLQSELDSAKAEIRYQRREVNSYMTEARTDELTGVANRRAFEEEVRRRLAQWHRQGTPLSMLVVDIDHFKRFNDFHGHQAGDLTLQQVANALARCLREMDFLARYGGEEFAVILPGTKLDEAKITVNRLMNCIREENIEYENNDLRVTVSIGLAQAGHKEGGESLFKRADESMYAAKASGRNCGYFHSGENCSPVQEHVTDDASAFA